MRLPGNSQWELQKGELVGVTLGPSACGPYPVTRLYDSREWQIPVPIYYIQGEQDPATPLAGALYHYENQIQAKKTFIKVPEGGHNPLSYGLDDCYESLLKAILLQSDLGEALGRCQIKPVLVPI